MSRKAKNLYLLEKSVQAALSAIEVYNKTDIILVNDNDVPGFHYDLAWMQHLHNLPYSVGIRKTSPTDISIRIKSLDKKLAQELEPFQEKNSLLKSDGIVPAIKHIKQMYGIDKMTIHKSPLKDWNQKILDDTKIQARKAEKEGHSP